MISEFLVYLELGIDHILDPRGADHILFVVALTAPFAFARWRQVLVLVTAFTVGHSATLALATLDRVRVPAVGVELLIPLTILATALLDGVEVVRGRGSRLDPSPSPDDGAVPAEVTTDPGGARRTRYVFALVFGLIHGLGFSNFLRAALGGESSIVGPLFAFNVGLEGGQVVVVALVLVTHAVVVGRLGVPRRAWLAAVASTCGGAALYLFLGRLPV